MKIGYYVQGTVDEAFVKGLAKRKRYCPDATMEQGRFRGRSGTSLRREIRQALLDLKEDKGCDYMVVLTDADDAEWRDIYNREWNKVPEDCKHITVFGVANRNIECWLSIDRPALAAELGCKAEDIPADNPSGFVKRKFGVGSRGTERQVGEKRIEKFVSEVSFYHWLRNCKSFEHFWDQIYTLSKQANCSIPNERERP